MEVTPLDNPLDCKKSRKDVKLLELEGEYSAYEGAWTLSLFSTLKSDNLTPRKQACDRRTRYILCLPLLIRVSGHTTDEKHNGNYFTSTTSPTKCQLFREFSGSSATSEIGDDVTRGWVVMESKFKEAERPVTDKETLLQHRKYGRVFCRNRRPHCIPILCAV